MVSMTLSATIEARDDYVVLKIGGDYSRHDNLATVAEWKRGILEKWAGRPRPVRLLVDMRSTTGLVSQGSGFRHFVENWGAAGSLRVAWLYADPRNEPRFLYREAVARHHGFFARSFRDSDQGVRWLTDSA